MSEVTIDQILRKHACLQPDKVAYRFLEDGEHKEVTITYGQLHQMASGIAYHLKARKKDSLSLALLLYPSGLEFIAAFFGCLYADIVAVPMPIPKKIRTSDRFTHILKDTSFEFILTDSRTFNELQRLPLFQSLERIQWILTDKDVPSNRDICSIQYVKKQPIAFLQYTSGSTSMPKGVMISHQNIMKNENMVKEAFGHDESTIFVGWLPLFHDMGLIGNILQPMYLGIPSILISPVAFLQYPLRWLKAISKYRATTSGAPNFAYKLCCEKIQLEDIHDMDLSCWKVAFNGSEPIHHKTLLEFACRFSPWGFQEESLYPCYGMAEATVFVAGFSHKECYRIATIDKARLESEHKAIPSLDGDYSLVSVGRSWQDGKIMIVNPDTKEICSTNEVGEVWLQGPHIALGYWKQEEVTKNTFQATLAKESGSSGHYLKTGDLGFINENNDLFITGRLKDLMIIRGRNIYPHDIELLIEENINAVRAHGCAAFSLIAKEEEQLVIVAEIEREKVRHFDAKKLHTDIRRLVSQEFQLNASAIVFIMPGTLPKTSSGKIQRSRCKQLFLEGQLSHIPCHSTLDHDSEIKDGNTIAHFPSSNGLFVKNTLKELEDKIHEILPSLTEEIDKDVPLAAYGIDSLGAISLQVFLKERWDLSIGFEEILGSATLRDLLTKIPEGAISSTREQRIARREISQIEHVYPLSYQQLSIWTELQIYGSRSGYNLAKAIELLSLIEVEKLRFALSLLMARHELLRARFAEDQPFFKILPTSLLPFEEKNLKSEELAFFFEEESLKAFLLEKEPLFRIWLLNVDSGHQVLFVVAHHLIADLWSFGIFVEELFQIYAHLPSLPHLLSSSHPYSNYIQYQQAEVTPANTSHKVEYWQKQLAAIDPFLKQNAKSFRGAHHHFILSSELSHSLRKYVKTCQVTPFTVLLTAYILIMAKHEGKSSLCIGTTFNGRNDPRWHSTFGMFANVVPLPFSLSAFRTFKESLDYVKKITSEGFGTFQLPFHYLLERLKLHAVSLFRAMFVFQQAPSFSQEFQSLIIPQSDPDILERGELQMRPMSWYPPLSTMDITLFMSENRGSFCGYFEYDISLFSKETVENLASNFLDILHLCLTQPKVELGDLIDKKTQVIPSTYLITNRTLIEQFDAIVEVNKDKCVLVDGTDQMSYAFLQAKSNQMARHFIRQGIRPDDLVALMFPHSQEVVIAILALLKIGAAFLPIHPLTPKSRIEAILKDSECAFMFSHEQKVAAFPSVKNISFSGMEQESFAPFEQMGKHDSIAYVMYTSGSTGTPKGVAVPHYALLNYLLAIEEHYGMKGSIHFPLYSSLAFDLTLTSLFFPILFGHTLYIYQEQKEISATLAEIFNHPLMTHVKLTPSHLKLLADIPFSSTRVSSLIVGGEQLPTSLVEETEKFFSKNINVINEYGPTEATIGCIYFIHPFSAVPKDTTILPIGIPIQGTRAYLLNNYQIEVPDNIPASLYLGGLNLAYGYWKRPQLTAEKFLPDPFIPGERVYYTGDLGKKQDNILSCLGREDRQIKIRGFRFELDEVESFIQKHPNIHQCVVTLHTNENQESILCAYITVKESLIFEEETIRLFLNEHLPHYMIPSAWIVCSALPLNINGKIDLRALPHPKSWLEGQSVIKKPENALQSNVRDLWANVLFLEPEEISITQSFFALGGDSIKAIQMVARGKTHNIHFTVADLFRYPTIEQLVLHLRNQNFRNVDYQLTAYQRLYLSPIQEWFFIHFSAHLNHYNQSVILHSLLSFDPPQIKQAFDILVSHHSVLRSRFHDQKSVSLIPHAEQVFSLEVVDFLQQSHWEAYVDQKMFDLQKNLDIASGPLIRLGLFFTPKGHKLGIVIHHLVTDGISWRIILGDFDRLLRQIQKGQQPLLPEKTMDYYAWAAHLDKRIVPKKDQLFPIARQKVYTFSLGNNISMTLLLKVHRPYQTQLQDILLSALYTSLHKMMGIQDLELHLENHGRDGYDLSNTVGWFTALVPIILNVADPEDLALLIKTTKEQSKLRQDTTAHPTISFNYLGQLSSTEYQSFTYEPYLLGTIDPLGNTPYGLQLMAWIYDQQLHFHWIFDEQLYDQVLREGLLELYRDTLADLIAHCLSKSTLEYTPSDFDLEYLSWKDWEELQKQIVSHCPEGMSCVDKIYPLSSMQKGLIYQTLANTQSTSYIEQAVLEIEGVLSLDYIRQSLENLMFSHESLRSSFFFERLSSPKMVAFKYSSLPILEVSGSLSSYLEQDKVQGFHISSEPLLRVALLTEPTPCGPKVFLVWTFHHLILDGWSLSLVFTAFLDNLKLLYQNQSLPPPAVIALKGYADWQKKQNIQTSSVYWEKLLAQVETTSLPKTDMSLSTKPQTRARIKKVLKPQLIAHLQRSVEDLNLTLNSIFQAIWALLLKNFSGQNNIIFGTVLAGRNPEVENIENMVGLFIQTIPVIAHMTSHATFAHLANSIQSQLLESESHSWLPLGDIQALSPLKNHLINHLFIFENYPFAGHIKQSVEERQLPFKIISADLLEETHYDFVASVLPGSDWCIEIQYNQNIYMSDWVESICHTFVHCLTQIAYNPQIKLSELCLASEVEIEYLDQLNLTQASFPSQKTWVDLFEEQASKNFDTIALIFGENQLTYWELSLRAEQLAFHLSKLGVGPDRGVAIFLEKSLELIIGWLAILKAGGFYIPLDPKYSAERIKMICEESLPDAILTLSTSIARLPSISAQIISLDQYQIEIEEMLVEPLKKAEPENLAYVLYTSGSTGKPKGIAMTHQAVCNHAAWTIKQFSLNQYDRMLQLTTFSFDVAICELHILLVGGTLIIPPEDVNQTVHTLVDIIESQRVTFLQFVPTLLKVLLNQETIKKLATVRQVLCGADVLKKTDLEKWNQNFSIPITNLYGLTETCIDATYFDCQDMRNDQAVPIGKPLSNVETYIFDQNLSRLPREMVGELYIGGLSLARGYHMQSALTAERFIPHPFKKGERLFHTKDRAFVQKDGQLQYKGRVDFQLKIRGYRIEPEEIEANLLNYNLEAHIHRAIVKAVELDSNNLALCAYFVADKELNVPHLKAFLEQRLPHYMIPTYYLQLQEFPLNSNGKIDLHRLPKPEIGHKSQNVAPQNEIEEKLEELWKNILNIQQPISVDSNFFDIGGNSMSLMQVHYQLSEFLGRKIPIQDLFQYPSIRALGDFLNQKNDPDESQLAALTSRIQKQHQRRKKDSFERISL